MLIGTIQITKRLLQRLTVHPAQPGRCGLLFHLGEFGRKIVVRKRCAGLLVVLALAIQGPIPNEAPRTCELIEQAFLSGSRVKAIAIGSVNGSLHGSILPEQMFCY